MRIRSVAAAQIAIGIWRSALQQIEIGANDAGPAFICSSVPGNQEQKFIVHGDAQIN